ncbi:MAG: acyl-CoA dehydrogenase family protein [Acidiferrobacterales bacterium]
MPSSPEVLIVGAGPAGIAAALRLARAGVSVMVLEGAEYAGAENWSGCVYHADSLLREDVLGQDLWRQAPKERRIVARSLFLHDGINAAGFEARAHADNDYGEAWTVLRPKLDRWLASRAIDFGVTLITATTATGLRYRGDRVVGVNTDRGPVDAPLVFLAEGDAAGLLAREGIEREKSPHYAQGIMALFRLSPSEIEKRFGLGPGEGMAQEWLLRNGKLAGRPVRLNMTAFLYTNHDTLSLGLVLPLDRLATAAVADHPHLFERVRSVPVIASYLEGAQQVAYGAKVIRSGGVDETPEWVRDGLAIGGGGLGLGQEVPYPNFIGPAIASALTFADAVLRIRQKGADYTRALLEQEYAEALRRTTEFRNAALMRRWPDAIHRGPLLFDHLPAMLGQLVDAELLPPAAGRAQRRRALGIQLAHLRRDAAQTLRLARGLGPSLRTSRVAPPLQVQFLVARAAGAPVAIAVRDDALLALAAQAIGHFYGRRLPEISDRVAMVWRSMRRLPLALPRIAGLGLGALAGGVSLVGDLTAYKAGRLPLRELLLRPYHRYDESARTRLDWGLAHRSAASPTTWIAPLVRRQPDLRHVTVPLGLGVLAQQLRNVCPAEVYSLVGKLGGVTSQHENCIKCESCRVTVPGVDWNRNSGHRFVYRVPGNVRSGSDSSVTSELELVPAEPHILTDSECGLWQRLYQSLRARPAMVPEEWPRAWGKLLKEIPRGALSDATRARLGVWLHRHAYGWMETEVHALLEQARAVPVDGPGVRDASSHAMLRRQRAWQRLKSEFPSERLKLLENASWEHSDRRAFQDWIVAARAHRSAAVEWLAAWSSALAWMAAGHYLAEAYAGRSIDNILAAPLWREEDGNSNWLSAVAECLVDMSGGIGPVGEIVAHGAGADAAQPVRRRIGEAVGGFSATAEIAELSVALALGQATELRRRALDYAAARVQFRGELKDIEGRESIAKFGVVKQMLAGLEHACALLDLARRWCQREPGRVLSLVRECMGPWMDAVPWLAGQIFGGMAYSEEDILAPRYRDSILFSQWPGSRSLGAADPDFNLKVFGQTLREPGIDPVIAQSLLQLEGGRRCLRTLRPPQAEPQQRHPQRAHLPLLWEAHKKFTYRSGAFLSGFLLSPDKLLVHEHFRRDPLLRRTRAEVLRLLRRGFRSPRRGEPYGRYIDYLHGMPEADIQLMRDFNAFATIVPDALGGKGWSKAQYSVLTNLCMGEKDTATGLLIMASTSIGTMPVLLGSEKDLPRLRREIEGCLADVSGWGVLEGGLEILIEMIKRPEPKALRSELDRLGGQMQRMFLFPGSTLKYLMRDFLELVHQTVQAAKARDLEIFGERLRQCRAALPGARTRLMDEQRAIDARQRAHSRFLQFLACGQISAFALTEPAAGSDTGGIQTRAVLREVEARADELGLYHFTPAGTGAPRLLLDAQQLVFESRHASYRMPDGGLARLDDSDWDMKRNGGRRRIRAGERTYPYDDIGTVIVRDGRTLYRYWELSGNKMWITNGSIADRYCLYAQTASGETGFMLERRSEGLHVGPNENKLGQRASPTNELTLDRVRVSADQVIGFAGHGQVNALETLSVGRGGLVMSCATLAERVLREFLPVWQKDHALHAAAQAEGDRLQTLAARLVGLMDRSDLQRGDFRIEAALSKYLASEGAHRILGWLETLFGPDAAAREVMLEKWRRDIRILNIYEGTNEVQRFLVLKDLPNLLHEQAAPVADNAMLDAALREFREFAIPRVAELGASIWQNPDLQARWFQVVDWVAELYSWSAMHERIRLLESHGDPVDQQNIGRLRASETSIAQHVQDVARMVRADFQQVEGGEAGLGDASLVLARAALARPPTEDAGPVAVGALCGEWAVVLRSRFEPGASGLEWTGWNPADLAVQDRLLSWSDWFPALQVNVAAIAPPGIADALRRLQAAGAQVLHIIQPAGSADTAGAAQAILRIWPQVRRWAFGCAASSARDHGFVANMARLLGVDPVEGAAAVGSVARGMWMEDATGRRRCVADQRRTAFAWDLKPGGRAGRYGVQDWLAALRTELRASDAPAHLLPVAVRAPAPPSATDLPQRFADARELAVWLKGRFVAGAVPDEPTDVHVVQTPLPGCTLWLTPADALTGASRLPALRALNGLGTGFGVLAWLPAGLSLPPVSAQLCQPGFAGVWQLPLHGAPPDAALADPLAELIGAPRRIVLGAGHRMLGAALAARLGVALFDEVVRVSSGLVTCSYEGYEADYPLPAAAVLIVGRSCSAPALALPRPAPVLVTLLPAVHLRHSALARFQARADAGGGLATAKLIVDVGLGVANGSNYKELVPSLCAALERISGAAVELGATRKVTQELKLLPLDRQIGQTGIPVAPALLLALGVSGAPQHMGWIDPGAVVIAINRDPDAPIFSWSRQNPGPRVIGCIGNLEEWVPALVRFLSVDGTM